ncbi:MAG: nitroreductase family protein [Deltaproteobacteria bacterium]|nr:nitroreductase family protein [Deltaproteobacteria bacterium]
MNERLATFYELYNTRRSIREFLEREIEPDKKERLMNILRRAQSAANCQPWHFVVLEGKDREKLFSVFSREGFKKAPLIIAACAEPSKSWVRKADGQAYAWVDVAIAITEMIGAATAEGLGTCWVAAIDPKEVKKILAIPEDIDIVSLICMGYPQQELRWEEKKRKPMEDIIHYGKW